jgi:hypothetical protein
MQTAALEARLTTVSESLNSQLNSVCENLKAEMKMENEKLAASLANKSKADHEKLRQEVSLEVQTEINNRTKEIELLRKDTEIKLGRVSDNVEAVYTKIDERLNVHVVNTRKEIAENEREINQRSSALVKEINDHKLYIDTAVESVGQGLAQTKEEVSSRVEGLASEIKTVSTAILTDKQNTLSEFQKVNLAISQIEAKIAGSATPHHSSFVRTEDVGQSSSKITGPTLNQSEHVSGMGVNGLGACSASACAASVVNVPDLACTENVSAASVVTPDGYTNLDEFSLPKFKSSTKQVVMHFLRELDEYFSVRKTPTELKLPLCFKAIEDPFAKQWFTTIYKTVGTYENFKTAFTNLLWGQTRQAQIRCSIYQDRWDRKMSESYTEHYIRYASLASMLNPPLSEEDLAGAMVGHFPPEVQNGMICGNLKTNQDALAYLGNMQGLEITREQMRRPRSDYEERDANTRPPRGRINGTADHGSRDTPQTRNVRYVQGSRNNTDMRRRSPRRFGRNGDSSGWGSSRRQECHSLSPRAQEFEPLTHNREEVAGPSVRGQDTESGNALNA